MQSHLRLMLSFFLLFAMGSALLDQTAFAQYLDPEKAITQYVHESWDVEDGLPQGSINAIAQTPEGYMWFGTQEGLVRFDGIHFTVFNTRNVDVLRSNDIRKLTVDTNGALWIGTRNAGLVRYKDNTFAVIVKQDSLEHRRITAILESKNGVFWIGTAEAGLKQLSRGKITHVDAIAAKNITALHETSEGVLWVGTREQGLIRYAQDEVVAYTDSTGLPGNAITSLASSRHGGIWIGTRDAGLSHYHGGMFFNLSEENGLPSGNILSLFEDPVGSLWIGTNQKGVARLTLDTAGMERQFKSKIADSKPALIAAMHDSFEDFLSIATFTANEGLTYDVAKSFFQDREGNLWIGTDGGGVNMLREGKFTTYTTSEGVADDFVYAVHEDLYGDMWFSTGKGVSRLKDNKITSYSSADGLGSDFVVSLESTPDSSIWMGTYGGGLARYSNGKFRSYTTEDGLPGDAVFGLYRASSGNLWVATGAGAAAFDGKKFTPYTTEEGLSSNYITVMLEAADSSVWIGTYDAGINRIVDGDVQFINAGNGLSNDAVLSLYEDEDGVIWVGTYGGGLNRIKDGQTTVYTTKEGLFNDNVVQILEDDYGNLWISCNQGLFSVQKQELNDYAAGKIGQVSSVVYDESDGLKSKEFNGGVQPAGWKSKNGELWFPSSKGVAMINPGKIMTNPFPPIMRLEEVISDGEAAPLEGTVEFMPGQRKIEFHYVGLSFVSPEKISYKYMLEGVDMNWVDAGTRRAAYYTNLEPGEYTFRVIAINSDNLESKEAATYAFYLKPFFYQTIWFYVVTVFSIVLLIFVVYKRRVAKIKEHERMLAQLVDERTQNLEERTADLLMALEENKEILGITSHDLKNPLGGIIGLADILLEDFAEMEENPQIDEGLENARLIKTEAERMLRIVMDLLDRHRAGEQMDHVKEDLNLGALIADSVRRNQQSADQKEIQVHFNNDQLLLVEADEDAMLRVTDNLLSNAIKYSPAGANVWINLIAEESWVRLEVKDEGPGLTEEDKQKVFGKMQRLSAQPTAGEHSTGLGLFIVKQLIEDNNGSVGVESEYGNGACFWVKIPLLNAFATAGS